MTALTAAGAWAVGGVTVSGAGEPPDAPAPPAPNGTAVVQGGGQQVPLAPPDKQPPDLKVPEPVRRKVGWAVVGLGELPRLVRRTGS